jgi:GNAT superfamily N-acetyltransferase
VDDVRKATVADAEELVRLRAVLMASIYASPSPDDAWQPLASDTLRHRLAEADPTLLGFVVERPEEPGSLAACAFGTLEYRLGGPGNPSGRVGYIFNVVTDPEHRRKGYSRRCVIALLDWYRDRGVRTIDLRASADGEPLYRSLGFARTPDPAMRLRLPPPQSE